MSHLCNLGRTSLLLSCRSLLASFFGRGLRDKIIGTFDSSDRWDEPLYSDRPGELCGIELLGNDILGQSVRFRVLKFKLILRRMPSV